MYVVDTAVTEYLLTERLPYPSCMRQGLTITHHLAQAHMHNTVCVFTLHKLQ